jgi:hypothetical protein
VIVRGPLRAPKPARVWNAAPTTALAYFIGNEKAHTSFTTWIIDILECEWVLVHCYQLQNRRREITTLNLWRIEVDEFVESFLGEQSETFSITLTVSVYLSLVTFPSASSEVDKGSGTRWVRTRERDSPLDQPYPSSARQQLY